VAVPWGQGAAAPSEVSAPLWPPKLGRHLPKFSESLLCISCHFNAFMFCDILMIYIILTNEFACVYNFI